MKRKARHRGRAAAAAAAEEESGSPVVITLIDSDDDADPAGRRVAVRRKSVRQESKRCKADSELLPLPVVPNVKGTIELTFGELRRLRPPGECVIAEQLLLNDSLVDYYVQLLTQEKLKPDVRSRVHIFNSFFLRRLRSSIAGKRDPNLTELMRWVQVRHTPPPPNPRRVRRARRQLPRFPPTATPAANGHARRQRPR